LAYTIQLRRGGKPGRAGAFSLLAQFRSWPVPAIHLAENRA
jgi:hypothetical protein